MSITWSILDEVILPQWVWEVLSFDPKHPVRDKFIEIRFLSDMDSFLSELKLKRISGENICKIEVAAKRYAMNKKQNPLTKVLKKQKKF